MRDRIRPLCWAMVLGTQLSIGMAHAQDPKFVYGTPLSDIEKPIWKASAQAGLILATGNDGQYRRTCDVLGVPELKSDPRFVSNDSPSLTPFAIK